MKYKDFIDCIMSFTKGEDPFVHMVQKNGMRTFYLASVENTWEYIDVSPEENIWKTFKKLFLEV
jgi:hypothetical protein